MESLMKSKPDTYIPKDEVPRHTNLGSSVLADKDNKEHKIKARRPYPKYLESYTVTKTGVKFFLRPVKAGDEHMLKAFFPSVSDKCIYQRFGLEGKVMNKERLKKLVNIDYMKQLAMVAILQDEDREMVAGLGQYTVNESTHTAEIALAVRDDYQNAGIGENILFKLTYEAELMGLLGFTAEVPETNQAMLHLFSTMGFYLERHRRDGIYYLKMWFRQ